MREILKAMGVDANQGYNEVKQKLVDALPNTGDNDVSVTNVINYFLYAGGVVAVVMIIVAGVQMATSAGDAGAVAKAKRTMTWAICGLVVMILAYAIVNFVIGKL